MADIDVTTLPSYSPSRADHAIVIDDSDSSLNDATLGDIADLAVPANIGAIAAPSSPTVGDFLVYTNNGWAAMTLSVWQGGSY